MKNNEAKSSEENFFDFLVSAKKKELKGMGLSYDELLNQAAYWSCAVDKLEKANESLGGLFSMIHSDIKSGTLFMAEIDKLKKDYEEKMAAYRGILNEEMEKAFAKGAVTQKHRQAIAAAEARHSKPGGSREKVQKIRQLWASGKYKSRDICAEQECAALDMSFATARKALRGTPAPT